MIIAYSRANQYKPVLFSQENVQILNDTTWIDLLSPTKEEETFIETLLKLDIPTREEMQEIEISSRLYKEDNAVFMTVTMVAKSDSPHPKSDAVTLILTDNIFITVRYIEPHSFANLISRITKSPGLTKAADILMELLDVSIDRIADILEKVSHGFDDYSQALFHSEINEKKPDYKKHLQGLALNGDLTAKVRESLITFNRLLTFLGQTKTFPLDNHLQEHLNVLTKDILSLSDYVNFLSSKVNFLLDATLGLVNIEQNNIIKIFSIAAVILLPPTLVASIYGMNFHHVPELSWRFGYPFALLIMVFSAWLPYKFFKTKKMVVR